MKQVNSISIKELQKMAEKMYGNLVKADVDVAKRLLLVDMELHADGEAYLLDNGSSQQDIWGFNLYPQKFKTDEFIEFDSMINIKPSLGNTSRNVLSADVRARITEIVKGAVHD
ncbi:hypothetical protein KBB76_02815 [Candidatus Saccharibacteria bacterium]|jgi:hypothetical protein|nr:hypothetical protein [Candidatus Saccharibacteria bacterium]HPW48251.1 DUF5674 family protein [Candidatus Saccharibacteria bacterium]